MRASVTEARATVYVCVHTPRECERKDVHAYCTKMLAAQQTKPWLKYGGEGDFARWRVSRKVAVQLRLQHG